jgi:hypothetical protein
MEGNEESCGVPSHHEPREVIHRDHSYDFRSRICYHADALIVQELPMPFFGKDLCGWRGRKETHGGMLKRAGTMLEVT